MLHWGIANAEQKPLALYIVIYLLCPTGYLNIINAILIFNLFVLIIMLKKIAWHSLHAGYTNKDNPTPDTKINTELGKICRYQQFLCTPRINCLNTLHQIMKSEVTWRKRKKTDDSVCRQSLLMRSCDNYLFPPCCSNEILYRQT